jgi:hypothetical protein
VKSESTRRLRKACLALVTSPRTGRTLTLGLSHTTVLEVRDCQLCIELLSDTNHIAAGLS